MKMEPVMSGEGEGGEPMSRDFGGESPRAEGATQASYPPSFARWLNSEYDHLNAQVCRAAGPSLAAHMSSEDLLQESLLVALRKWKDSRAVDGPSFRAWVMGIARNRIRDVRRARRSAPPFVDNAEKAGRDMAASSCGRAGLGEAVEERRNLLNQLDALPSNQRLCVIMRSQLDLPWPMIALTLRRSIGGARNVHSRAMESLRNRASARGV